MRKIFATAATACGLFAFVTLAHSAGAMPGTAGQKEVCEAALKTNQAKLQTLAEKGDKAGMNALMAASGCPNSSANITKVEVTANDNKHRPKVSCTGSFGGGKLTFSCTVTFLRVGKVDGGTAKAQKMP